MNIFMLTGDPSNFTPSQVNTIIIVNEITSGISIACGIMVIILFWFFKEIRLFIYELAVWLCISNILYDITAFFPYDNNKDNNKIWCGCQAFMIILFQTATWMWSCMIGYSSFISAIKKNHIEKYHHWYRGIFTVFTYLVSGGLASIVIATDTFGPTGGWCWLDVSSSRDPLIWKLILFYYLVNWFFIILNSFFIFKVTCLLGGKDYHTEKKQELMQIYQTLKWFPIAQIVCVMPGTVNRMFNILQFEQIFPLVMVQTILGSLMTTLYFLIYIRLPHVKISLRAFFRRLCLNRTSDDDNRSNSPIISSSERNSMASGKGTEIMQRYVKVNNKSLMMNF